MTIFGESQGAMEVIALMSSPAARGLFHKAISQSAPQYPLNTQIAANQYGKHYVDPTVCGQNNPPGSPALAACMRATPVDVLVNFPPDQKNDAARWALGYGHGGIALANKMQDYWTNFAKKKNPNPGSSTEWPSFTVASPSVLRLNSYGNYVIPNYRTNHGCI